jgi:hypothetical protein
MTTMEMTATTLPDCPFRGLDPYTESDRDYFVGREEDSLTISANVLTSPVTVLYGPSGVGKSSILMAGVVPLLEVQRNVTTVVFRSWQESDLIPALNRAIAEAVLQQCGSSIETGRGFDFCVASAVAETNGVIAILFDQFEEFLLYHDAASASGIEFDPQFARLVNRTNAPVKFLISIREDWVAKLDRFQHYIPNLLGNLIRLDHLDMASARRATIKPIEQYNSVLRSQEPDAEPYAIEPELVEIVLDQVKIGSVSRPGEGAGKLLPTSAAEPRIETAFLQMILSTLWNAEKTSGSRTLRVSTLHDLGGAERIVRRYVDDFVRHLSPDQKDACVRIFNHLITPSGSKIAHTLEDLREFAGDKADSVVRVLQFLTTNHILRRIDSPTEVVRYEIFHDVLALPILQWRTRHITSMRERQRARRAATQRLFALSAILVLVIIASAWLTRQHNHQDEIALTRTADHEHAQHLLSDARKLTENRQPVLAGQKLQQAKKSFASLADDSGLVAADEVSRRLIEIGMRVPAGNAMPYFEAALKGALSPRRRVGAILGMAHVDAQFHRLISARRRVNEAAALTSGLGGSTAKLWRRIAHEYEAAEENTKAISACVTAQSKAADDEMHLIADCEFDIGIIHDAMGHRDAAIASLLSAMAQQRSANLLDDQARTASALSRIFGAAPGGAADARKYQTMANALAADAHDNRSLLHSDEAGDATADR